jgi:hypothetical protein
LQVIGSPIHFLRIEEIIVQVYSFSVIRGRSSSIQYGFMRLYEKSWEKSMIRLVERRVGFYLKRFTSNRKSSYVLLFLKSPFLKQTLSCWLVVLILSRLGSNTPCLP